MTFVAMPDKAAGDQYTEAMWDQMKDNFNKGVMRPIAETILGAPAASITLSSIAADWSTLWLSANLRSVVAAFSDGMRLRYNGDTGANYDYQGLTTTTESFGATSLYLGNLPGASSVSGNRSSLFLVIPNYVGTTAHKAAHAMSGATNISGHTNDTISTVWRSTAAITSIQLFTNSGSNLDTGSRVTLMGVSNI
jgi:hypothetical protein